MKHFLIASITVLFLGSCGGGGGGGSSKLRLHVEDEATRGWGWEGHLYDESEFLLGSVTCNDEICQRRGVSTSVSTNASGSYYILIRAQNESEEEPVPGYVDGAYALTVTFD